MPTPRHLPQGSHVVGYLPAICPGMMFGVHGTYAASVGVPGWVQLVEAAPGAHGAVRCPPRPSCVMRDDKDVVLCAHFCCCDDVSIRGHAMDALRWPRATG